MVFWLSEYYSLDSTRVFFNVSCCPVMFTNISLSNHVWFAIYSCGHHIGFKIFWNYCSDFYRSPFAPNFLTSICSLLFGNPITNLLKLRYVLIIILKKYFYLTKRLEADYKLVPLLKEWIEKSFILHFTTQKWTVPSKA